MKAKSLKDYDDELFIEFKKVFCVQFEDKFKNEKLYNTWGRKCNFIIKILKNIQCIKKNDVKKVINILIEFLSDKESSNGLQYLSSFSNEIYKNYTQKMLAFRNEISSFLFTLINFFLVSKKGEIMIEINKSLYNYLDNYNFLKCLFILIQYSLDSSVDIFEEFMLLLNNNDIIKKIIENKNCTLNYKQKAFLQQQKFDLANCNNLLKELKEITINNEELLLDILSAKNSMEKKKTKKHKSKNNNKDNKEENKKTNLNQTPSKNIISNLPLKNKNEDYNVINEIENSLTDQLTINQNEDKEPTNFIYENKNESLIENKENSSKNNDIKKSGNLNLAKTTNEIPPKDNDNEKVKLIEEQNKMLIEKIKSYDEKNQKLKDYYQNKIDILESQIGMICYRDLIKDLINYSFNYFKCHENKNYALWKKVKSIKNKIISSSNDNATLNSKEREIFSNFINISFIALKNVNYNVHEGFYISNYSIEDFIRCFKNYIDLYDIELLTRRNKNKIDIPNAEEIKAILNKIHFVDEDDFTYDDEDSS